MKSFYNNKCASKLYTPLTYEEGLLYINKWFERNHTAFNKDIIVVKSVNKDGTIYYVQKAIKIVKIISSIVVNQEGGTSLPLKQITVDEQGVDSKLKKGMLVYFNLPGYNKTVKVWECYKRITFDLTDEYMIYTVIMDGFTMYEPTNLGKYGTWDLNTIKNM